MGKNQRQNKCILNLIFNSEFMSNPFISLINQYLPEPEASLLNGMLFGEIVGFSRQFYQDLITTGTIHVVALSGMNITILTNIVSKITLPLGRRLSSIVSILAVVGFILFVGPSPTVVRAGIMGVLTFIAIYFGRQNLTLFSLFIAGALMIIVNTSIIKDVSFQLSFLATLGIIVFVPQALKPKKEKKLLKGAAIQIKTVFLENLRTTLAAQIATLPVIAFTFSRISSVSPLTNVLVGWSVSLITVLGLSLCLIGIVFFPLGQIIAWFTYVLLHYFVVVVNLTAKIPYASLILNQ